MCNCYNRIKRGERYIVGYTTWSYPPYNATHQPLHAHLSLANLLLRFSFRVFLWFSRGSQLSLVFIVVNFADIVQNPLCSPCLTHYPLIYLAHYYFSCLFCLPMTHPLPYPANRSHLAYLTSGPTWSRSVCAAQYYYIVITIYVLWHMHCNHLFCFLPLICRST